MLRTAIRWRELAELLPSDISEELFDNDELVSVLDVVEDILRERADWIDPQSDLFDQHMAEAKHDGGELVREAMLDVVSEALYRQSLFGETLPLVVLEQQLEMVDVKDVVERTN